MTQAGPRRVLPLLTDIDPASGEVRRSVSLEASADGLSIQLVHIDSSRQGTQQEYCVEIATSELIDLIRIHGVDNQLIDSHGFKFEGIG
jgi:hypothetical protein